MIYELGSPEKGLWGKALRVQGFMDRVWSCFTVMVKG